MLFRSVPVIPVLRKISHGSAADTFLFSAVHSFQRTSAAGGLPEFYFQKYKRLSVKSDDINLPASVLVISFYNPVSFFFQIPHRGVFVSGSVSPVISDVTG